ncbi:MAG: transposase, partial [Epsilonproteobacteria bacterium]|nr:transposase [Campylobacterota bacterium]
QVALAIEECIKIGGYHKNTVKRLLEHYPISKPAFDLSVKRHITLPFEDITRDLSQYSEVSYE